MNNITKKQLEQLGVDVTQTHFFFPKKQEIKLVEDNYYLIHLTNDALFPNPGAVWVTNWNSGRIPGYAYYKVDINKILNDMVKVTGVAWDPVTKQDIEDTECTWSGWLPLSCIEVMQRL